MSKVRTDTFSQGENALYYVYRSDSGLDGFGEPVHEGSGTSYGDDNAPVGTWYQVRVARLKTTGSGSYWDMSQGVFVVAP